jgi:hypothetical protein
VKAGPLSTATAPEASRALSVERFLTAWVEVVNDYLQRQYRDIIQRQPAPETLTQYKSECKWLLRSALNLDSLVNDPEYPARQFRPEIAGKLLQLQESWDSLNNPLTDTEADTILQKVFPDESRTGRPA